MNYLNPQFENYDSPICDFIDENFYLSSGFVMFYFGFMDYFVGELIFLSLKSRLVNNAGAFNFINYLTIEEAKNDLLLELIYFFVNNFKDSRFLPLYCSEQNIHEIRKFIRFLLKLKYFDIEKIKNYEISFEALKDFSTLSN